MMKNLFTTHSPRYAAGAAILLIAFATNLRAQTLVTAPMTSTPATGDYYHPSVINLGPGFEFVATSGNSFYAYISTDFCAPLSGAPSVSKNFAAAWAARVSGLSNLATGSNTTCQVSLLVNYYDGLGRSEQTVQVKGSPGLRDLVQPLAYDVFGREAVKYLPYAASTGTAGTFRSSAISSEQGAFYTTSGMGHVNTAYPTATTVFEPSPLNRAIQQGAPGAPWQPGSGATVNTGYSLNASSEVPKWILDSGGDGASWSTYYGVDELYRNVVTDENGNEVIEFKDKAGKVILKQAELGSGYLSTFYLYNEKGNLMYVVPPIPVREYSSGVSSFDENDDSFTRFMYGYHYDDLNRVIEKKIPGKGWENIIYDKLDRPVIAQDGNQAAGSTHSFTKYDGQGRVIITGVETNRTASRATIQGYVDGWSYQWEERDASGPGGYTNNAIPTATTYMRARVINFYDDYDIPSIPFSDMSTYSKKSRGLLTATRTRVLSSESDFDGGTWLWTVYYYDDDGRVVRTRSQVYGGGEDLVVNTYSFTGELLTSTRTHSGPSSQSATIASRWEYDHMGRKIASYSNIDAAGEVKLGKYEYNELGQLLTKRLHNELQTTELAYNERGWLKNSTSSQFSFQLNYQDGTTPQYNGNISGQLYSQGTALDKTFTYTYDKLNRLLKAVSNDGLTEQGSSGGADIGYDELGNITALYRQGTSMGQLTYSYTGNKLTSLSGYRSGSSYDYDANGNMIEDHAGKDFTYNSMNLITTVSGVGYTYLYDGVGKKLEWVKSGATRTYRDGIEYLNGAIDIIHTEEGIARKVSGGYSYEYTLKDHLGNSRYSFDINAGAPRKIQSANYYAFGLEGQSYVYGTKNEHLYNGKELQEETGFYDYGARQYDPVVGRWNGVDPYSEDFAYWSPYNYATCDPISNIDPDGKSSEGYATRYVDPFGNTLLNTNDGRDDIYLVPWEQIPDFMANVSLWEVTQNNPGVLDSKQWNNFWRGQFPQVVSDYTMKHFAIGFNELSDDLQKKAIKYWITKDESDFFKFELAYIKAQWSDPATVALSLTAFAHATVGIVESSITPKYAARVRSRGVEDPVAHNFPYSFDETILRTKPTIRPNGYKIYRMKGTVNGKEGVFEIGVNNSGVIDHRTFRSTKK